MMSSEEMTSRVLAKLDEHEAAVSRRRRVIRRYSAAGLSLCAAVMLCIGVHKTGILTSPGSVSGTEELLRPGTASSAYGTEQNEANINSSAAASCDTDNVTCAGTVTSAAGVQEPWTASATEAVTVTSENNTQPSSEGEVMPAASQPSTDAPAPTSAGANAGSGISSWELGRVCSTFPLITIDNVSYSCTGGLVTSSDIGPTFTETVYEIPPTGALAAEEENVYASVFELDQPEGAIAVRFTGRNEFIIYIPN